MRALYLHKLNQEKAGKVGKGRKADRAPCLANIKTRNWLESHQISSFLENVKQAKVCQANRNNQTRSRRQKDCVVNEVQHAKWIYELG